MGQYYTNKQIRIDYKEFKLRIREDRQFCESLFRHATIRLLCFKYAYYVINKFLACDSQYDLEEKGWYIMGRALGKIKKDETTPCVGFDEEHPLAKDGIKLAHKLKESKSKKKKMAEKYKKR